MEILIAQKDRFMGGRITGRQGKTSWTKAGPVQKIAIGRLLGKKCGGRHDAGDRCTRTALRTAVQLCSRAIELWTDCLPEMKKV